MLCKPFAIVEAALLTGYRPKAIKAMLDDANRLTSGRYDIDMQAGTIPVVQLLPGLAYIYGTDLAILSEIIDGVVDKNRCPVDAIDIKTVYALRWMIDDFTALYCDKDKWPAIFNGEECLATSPRHLASLVCLLGAVKRDMKPIAVIKPLFNDMVVSEGDA